MSTNVPIVGPLVTVLSKTPAKAATTIYTAAQNSAWIVGLQVANTDTVQNDVTITLVKGGVSYAVVPLTSVAAKGSLEGPTFPIALRRGDEIQVAASQVNVIDIILVVMESPGPLR